MNIIDSIREELRHEGAQTRRTLERAPEAHFGWKPHEKSFSLGHLASHLSDVPGWLVPTIKQGELNFDQASFKPFLAKTTAELVANFDAKLADALAVCDGVQNDHLMQPWTLRSGDQMFFTMPRIAVIRSMILNHAVHHRGQLTVYYRLLNVPVPALYGPSADEH